MERIGGRLAFEAKHQGAFQLTRLASVEDEIFLEDEVQRIVLTTTTAILDRLTTGVVTCLRGCQTRSTEATFRVVDAVFLEPQPLKPITSADVSSASPPSLTTGHWVGFVSGLGFAGSAEAVSSGHALALRLLADWLRRMPLTRLFILGDCIRSADSGCQETLGLICQVMSYSGLFLLLERIYSICFKC